LRCYFGELIPGLFTSTDVCQSSIRQSQNQRRCKYNISIGNTSLAWQNDGGSFMDRRGGLPGDALPTTVQLRVGLSSPCTVRAAASSSFLAIRKLFSVDRILRHEQYQYSFFFFSSARIIAPESTVISPTVFILHQVRDKNDVASQRSIEAFFCFASAVCSRLALAHVAFRRISFAWKRLERMLGEMILASPMH